MAQEKTTILTRKIEKQLELKKNPRIFINTERGIINVRSWDRDEVKVVLKLIAKNKDVAKAREELNYMNNSISETRNTVFVSNHMILKETDQQISSVIRAEYEILVPREIEIHVNNRFGRISIRGVKGGLFGELYYSDLSLHSFMGIINMHISIGDFTCHWSSLEGKVFTRHSNVFISSTSGKLNMETEYGTLRFVYGQEPARLVILGNSTDILIDNRMKQEIGLRLIGSYCVMRIARESYSIKDTYLKSTYQPEDEQKQWQYYYEPPNNKIRLIINTKFGTLNLM